MLCVSKYTVYTQSIFAQVHVLLTETFWIICLHVGVSRVISLYKTIVIGWDIPIKPWHGERLVGVSLCSPFCGSGYACSFYHLQVPWRLCFLSHLWHDWLLPHSKSVAWCSCVWTCLQVVPGLQRQRFLEKVYLWAIFRSWKKPFLIKWVINVVVLVHNQVIADILVNKGVLTAYINFVIFYVFIPVFSETHKILKLKLRLLILSKLE